MSDDLQPDVCSAAPYLLSLSEAHSPPEYGGRVKLRTDLSGPYVDVQLQGIHDSPLISAPNADLEDTGTYSVSSTHPFAFETSALASRTHLHSCWQVCHASFGTSRPASACSTWQPEPSDFGWYENVQVHVRHKN
jgi:hypothetical protein